MCNNLLINKIKLLYEQNRQKDELDILIDRLKAGEKIDGIKFKPKPKGNKIIKGSTVIEDDKKINKKDLKDFQKDDKGIEYPKTKNLEIENTETKNKILKTKELIINNKNKDLNDKQTKELVDYINEHPGLIGGIAATGLTAYAIYRYLKNKKKYKKLVEN